MFRSFTKLALTAVLAVVFIAPAAINDPQSCQGWFDYAAGACDSVGD